MKIFAAALALSTSLAAFGQERLPFSLPRQKSDLKAEDAIAKAESFLKLVGESSIVRKEERFSIEPLFPDVPVRTYRVFYRGHKLQMDAATGMLYSYDLSSAFFRKMILARTARIPTREQAMQIAIRTAQSAGTPPNARVTGFVLYDKNPNPDADTRGYFAITYVGSDRSNLHLVFDRMTGRLESLFRAVPRPKHFGK